MLGALECIVLSTLTQTQQRVNYLLGCSPHLYQRLTRNLAFG